MKMSKEQRHFLRRLDAAGWRACANTWYRETENAGLRLVATCNAEPATIELTFKERDSRHEPGRLTIPYDGASLAAIVDVVVATAEMITVENLAEELPRVASHLAGAAVELGSAPISPAEAAYARGQRLRRGGDCAGAASAYRAGLQLTPGDPAMLMGLGAALLRTGAQAEAEQTLRAVASQIEERLKEAPQQPQLLYHLACVHSLNGEGTTALQCLTRAIEWDPRLKKSAREELDFAPLSTDPTFLTVTREVSQQERVERLCALGEKATYKEVKRFDCYLAVLLRQEIRIVRENERSAYERLSAYFQTLSERQIAKQDLAADYVEQQRRARTLDDFFEHAETPLRRDQAGTVIAVDQGGDLWANDLLAVIADLIERDAFVSAVDDGGRFWRWRFDQDRLRYSRSRANRAALHLLNGA